MMLAFATMALDALPCHAKCICLVFRLVCLISITIRYGQATAGSLAEHGHGHDLELVAPAPGVQVKLGTSLVARTNLQSAKTCVAIVSESTALRTKAPTWPLQGVVASGCAAEPLNVRGLREGRYALTAYAEGAEPPTLPSWVPFSVVAGANDDIGYDWSPVGASMPAGAEVQLPLGRSGGERRVRIPQPWTLELDFGRGTGGIVRVAVQRSSTVEQLVTSAVELAKARLAKVGAPGPCSVRIEDKDVAGDGFHGLLPSAASAEDAQLFRRRRRLAPRWEPCAAPASEL